MSSEISAAVVYAQLGLPGSALIIDVRSDADYSSLARIIPGALRRDPERMDEWAHTLPHAPMVVTYRQRADDVGSAVNARLAELGYPARQLSAGIEGWISGDHPTVRIRADLKSPGASRWVTRERPKIDRLACPWLIRRFIDAEAQFFYTPPQRVRADAKVLGAEPYDITDVTFSHRGPRCSFDAFLDEFDLHDPVLVEVAAIVRAADTDTLDQSREAPGLLAISLGLSATIADDILLLEQAMPIYDALYAWRKRASRETHGWPQTQADA